jgi:hypothetical protein
MAHQESPTASIVLITQTIKKGLCGPSQLTMEKLPIRITTATISINFMLFRMKLFIGVVGIIFGSQLERWAQQIKAGLILKSKANLHNPHR